MDWIGAIDETRFSRLTTLNEPKNLFELTSIYIYILCKNDRWKRTVVNFKLTTFNSNNNNINSIVQRESYLYPK